MGLKGNFLSVGPQMSNDTLVTPLGMSARWIVQHEIIFGDFHFLFFFFLSCVIEAVKKKKKKKINKSV